MDNLNELVERYGNLKTEMDSYKKQVDSDNKEIKSIMAEMGISEVSTPNFTAKYSVAVSEDFDEVRLLDKINSMVYHEDGVSGPISVATGLGIVKMKPYVDMQALEDAIYNGKINAAELADCKVRKEVARLTIKHN